MKRSLLSMTLAVFSLSIAGFATAAPLSSVATDGLGVNYFVPRSESRVFADLDRMASAGYKYIRVDMTWQTVEVVKGTYQFDDHLLNACSARGIHILWILDYSNSHYDRGSAAKNFTTGSWLQAFTNYAVAVVTRYKGKGNVYELWNEPDGGGVTPTQYMNLAKTAILAMRKADPNCTIVGPATLNIPYLESCFQQGLVGLVDGISVHPYRSVIPETVATDYATIRYLMTKHAHKTLPIVSSEWGYTTGGGPKDTGSLVAASNPAQLQGDYLARSFLVNLSQGVPISIWFDWSNDGTDPTAYQQNFGTMTADLVAKPAYKEFKLLTRSLKGTTFSCKLNDGDASDWLLVFTTASGRKTLAAWTTGKAHVVPVSGWGSLSLSSTPIYINPVP